MRPIAALGLILAALAGCGPTPEQQAAMDAAQRAKDQQQCVGFGFTPGTDAFAHCMLQIASQREAQEAADRRQRAAIRAANDQAEAARRAAADAASRDAWDKRTGQGKYAHAGDTPPPPTPATDSGPDLSGMTCTGSTTTTGSANNSTTVTNTSCHN